MPVAFHAFFRKHAPHRAQRHQALNDVVARAFTSACVPVTKEPTGLSRSDGKRPDDMTLFRWQAGRPVVWDVTVSCTSADSYVDASALIKNLHQFKECGVHGA